MADKRMFSKTIIDSDAFLDMPLSTQTLYFHLSMRADDDGFINNPRKIQRMIGCGEDDLKLLIAKKFVIIFESGVIVIKHWRIHNYIQKDRYKETVYREEKSMLSLKENKAYTLGKINGSESCIQSVYKTDTQIRLDEISVDKSNVERDKSSLYKDNIKSLPVVVHSNNEVFKHFEKCGFILSPKLMEFIAADVKVYSSKWLIDAATESMKRGKINYKYLLAILQNWKADGRGKKAAVQRANAGAYKDFGDSVLDN
ncbi:DnaD domain protein [Clostridium chromiireducens]|uniref:DnaB/C C-terminal domain-containing protein n=1 Tax=Clostridium chromiireducens TaxID=225345 RepID=A0A1V4IJQ1_9CLOT|nr:DnaD domain protein [Clostridium chromiireducens]OPJ60242.1 hypothetical protein CLCHR_30070 [Clostridium chromiireducens]